ncbi:helix-turn-helix domain-containing protein [Belnapia sp. T6]|uniref:Helix-turn-helix domain-containing protein n=1 Tax=Belnapia mucosa TaxID=2804532 RepID=A0ABS1VAX3_9PROT|nr:helix-turn-helix domain-containing protein [Belnapia mucosa]
MYSAEPKRLAYSVDDAAKRIGCGRTTVFGLIRTGRLAAVKLGGRTLVTESALSTLLASLPPAESCKKTD